MASSKSKTISIDDAIDTIVYDEWIVPDKVRMLVDVSEVIEDSEKYQRSLMLYRGIPQKANAFRTDDPNINIAMSMLSHIKNTGVREERAVQMLISHYERLADECEALGFMLASTKINSFENEPKPYNPDWFKRSELPGIESLPDPVPDLTNMVEYRLKQLLDILDDHPGSFKKIQEKTRTLPIAINQKLKLGQKVVSPGE